MKHSICLFLLIVATCKGRPNPFDTKVSAALNNLVALDDRLDGDVTINYQINFFFQNMASKKAFDHDNAQEPLYTKVPASRLNGATYKTFDNLIVSCFHNLFILLIRSYLKILLGPPSKKGYLPYHSKTAFYQSPDIDTAETVTPAWEDSISAFLDAVIDTKVMQSAKAFLLEQGKTAADPEAFKSLLRSLWFTLYARREVIGSSGFEAVFAGEVRGSDVIRFNNWLRYYEQEKAGLINYHGWIARQKVGVQVIFFISILNLF
ncbi:unnamed protein product [Nippostrongylus brasiliensis]|uniref:Endoribonuclease n=1 Tax=Nippostrongylus brasiliensis TaxID=27835 RepID=A0A0N4YHE3_NIPBR|nr:unnamed protein product [Nippostrongylus brasiliensis]